MQTLCAKIIKLKKNADAVQNESKSKCVRSVPQVRSICSCKLFVHEACSNQCRKHQMPNMDTVGPTLIPSKRKYVEKGNNIKTVKNVKNPPIPSLYPHLPWGRNIPVAPR